MPEDPLSLLPSRILVVDDERPIHASIRLRLGASCELSFSFDARDALEKIRQTRFDLCIADINMPKMDGLAFIEAAHEIDGALGYVILSAFDSPENLRQSIRLHIYDFITKPLPGKADLESRVVAWVDRTRQRRKEQELARVAGEIANDRDAALLEREVELIASETARDALRQAASLLTTIHAHLLTSVTLLAPRARGDPTLTHVLRGLEEARKTSDAAVDATEGFLDSAYGDRETSRAVLDECIVHAAQIALHRLGSDTNHRKVDYSPLGKGLALSGLSGIEFLLTLSPAIGAALVLATTGTTVGIRSEPVARIDATARHSAFKSYYWINRRGSSSGSPAVAITVTADAPSLSASAVENWLAGKFAPLGSVAARGLICGIQKSRGLLGVAVTPQCTRFALTLVIPI